MIIESKEEGTPRPDWLVQSRKRGAEGATWEYALHFSTEGHARDFMQFYPALYPDLQWRIVKQTTIWEVVV